MDPRLFALAAIPAEPTTPDAPAFGSPKEPAPPLDSPGQGSIPEPLSPPIGREPDFAKEERFMRMYAPPHLALESMTIRCIDGNTEPGRHRANRQKKAARKRQKEARRRNR